MRFFLLAPYDFGASFKIIKMGGKISTNFPFNHLTGTKCVQLTGLKIHLISSRICMCMSVIFVVIIAGKAVKGERHFEHDSHW